MSMKKKALAAASYVMVAAMAIGGTVAYLTDTDNDVNVMTIGNVKIEQNEQQRDGSDFDQGQTIMPLVTPVGEKDANGYPKCTNYVDKIVTVENTGKNNAYVRTIIAIPTYDYDGKLDNNASANVLHWNGYSEGDVAPKFPAATKIPGTNIQAENHWYWGQEGKGAWPGNGGDWNSLSNVVIGDQVYTIYTITNTEVVTPGEVTAPNMIGLYLDSKVDFDGTNYTYDGKVIAGFDGDIEVLVASQAVQADGFANAWDAFEASFGDITTENHPWVGGIADSSTTDSITAELTTNNKATLNDDVYTTKYVEMTGATLDGNGNTLVKVGKVDTGYNAGVLTTGGTVKNLKIADGTDNASEKGFRAIYVNGMTENMVIENCELDGTYAINVNAADKPYTLTVSDSVLNGWTSYGTIGGASFTNCEFGMGNRGHAYLRAYADTTFTNCDFAAGFQVDIDDKSGAKLTFVNCRLNGVLLTADNIADLMEDDAEVAKVTVN